MNVLQPIVAEGYEWAHCATVDGTEALVTMTGSLAASWVPIEVRRVTRDGKKRFKPSHFPWLGDHALILEKVAVDALEDLLSADAEVLPLSAEGAALFVLNVRVVDALDESSSKIVRFPGSGRIMDIEQASFIRSRIELLNLFRLPHRGSPVYVSQHFVDRVRSAGLRGLHFEKVWSG